MDIEKVVDQYKELTTVRRSSEGDAHFIALPFFYPDYDESIAIKVTVQDDGRPLFSDCHTTFDYLEDRDIELDDYREKLDRIMKNYGLILDGNVFRMPVPSDDDGVVKCYLGYFVQALTLIARIDL